MVQLVHVNKNRSATSICTVGVGAAMHMQWGGARGSTFGVHMHGGHVAPTAVAMHMQWGGARGSTFGVHMHVSPPPTKTREKNFLRAKKTFCGSNGPNGLGCLCMWFWCAYACGSNGPNLLVCICMWLQRSQRSWLLMHVAPTVFLRRLGWYAYAVRSCICPRVTLDKKVPTFLLCICRALAAYARG